VQCCIQGMGGSDVNLVSAPFIAEERGIRVSTTTADGTETGLTNVVQVRLTTDARACEVAGTVFEKGHPRILEIDSFDVEVLPQGHLLVVFGEDKPGLIGRVGEALGAAGVNVARMSFGRKEAGGNALLALNLDSGCCEETLGTIRELPLVQEAIALLL